MKNYGKEQMNKEGNSLKKKELIIKLILLSLIIGVILAGIISIGKKGKNVNSRADLVIINFVVFFDNLAAYNPNHPDFINKTTQSEDISCGYVYEGGQVLSSQSELANRWNEGDENPERPGYVFSGWYDKRSKKIIDIDKETAFSVCSSGEGKVIAVWDFKPERSVIVDEGLGKKAEEVKVAYGENFCLPNELSDFVTTKGLAENEVSKTYTFKGWYSAGDFAEKHKVDNIAEYTSLGLSSDSEGCQYFYTLNPENKTVSITLNDDPGVKATFSLEKKLFAKWNVETTYKKTGGDSEKGNGGGSGTDNGNGTGTDNKNNGGNGSGSANGDKNSSNENDKNKKADTLNKGKSSEGETGLDSAVSSNETQKTKTTTIDEKNISVADKDKDGVPNYRDSKESVSKNEAYKTNALKKENINYLAVAIASVFALIIIGMILFFFVKKDYEKE